MSMGNETNPLKWVEFAGRAGVATILAFIIMTGQLGWWVFGTTYSEMKAEREQWKEVALKALNMNKVVNAMPPPVIEEVKKELEKNDSR